MVDFKKVSESIKANIEARKKAAEMKTLLDEEISEFSDSQKSRFWDDLFELVTGKFDREGIESSRDAMSYDEAMKFAHTEMIMGKHKGKRILDIPPDYFEWMASQPDYRKVLNRYLKSSYYRDVHERGHT